MCNEEWRFGSVLLDAGALSDAQLREAAELLAHLNEASFGYRSGDPGRPSPGEPRAGSIPAGRRSRSARGEGGELGCSVGEASQEAWRACSAAAWRALVDGRAARSATGPGVDERLRAAILAEARELAEASDVRKMQFRARVASRLARESGEPLELPVLAADVQPDRR